MQEIENFSGKRIIYFPEGITKEYYAIGGSELHIFNLDVYGKISRFVYALKLRRRIIPSLHMWFSDKIMGQPYLWTKSLYSIPIGQYGSIAMLEKEVTFADMEAIDYFVYRIKLDSSTENVFLHIENLENHPNVYGIKFNEEFPIEGLFRA